MVAGTLATPVLTDATSAWLHSDTTPFGPAQRTAMRDSGGGEEARMAGAVGTEGVAASVLAQSELVGVAAPGDEAQTSLGAGGVEAMFTTNEVGP